jgi:predicted DNA-binding transcriptional regulator AlpA
MNMQSQVKSETSLVNPTGISKIRVSLPAGLIPAVNTDQAAAYCGLASATMEGLRCKGGGPRFVRYGRKAVRYLIADLDAWMVERTVASTSEQVAA